jgi:hypothetical protein
MNLLFGSKQKTTPTKGDALAKLRGAIAEAVAAARQSGIDSGEIATILESNADLSRQNDAMSRPVL